MYLAPEGHEQEVADAAAAFLGDTIPLSRLRGPHASDLPGVALHEIAKLGWFGLAVPEQRGGSGLSQVEYALFFRELGRLCGPSDILAQCLAANVAQDPALRSALLVGQASCALVLADSGSFRLLGSPTADYGVFVTPERAVLVALDGIAADIRPALDRVDTMRVCSDLPPAIAQTEGDQLWLLGQLGTAAMLLGIAEAALDLIVEYAKVRETFGRKIGAWQAVRHPCADMAVRNEAARSQLWFAAAAAKEHRSDAKAHLAAAKHLANTAACLNADTNIQLHGGIGVTEEHNAHVLLKRALVLSRLFGSKRALLSELLHARLDD